jgi:hypothetical protein
MNENINKGVEYLDANFPGWYSRIDLSMLNMGSCYTCVLGQAARGPWEDGMPPEVKGAEFFSHEWDRAHGFTPDGDLLENRAWDALGAAWVETINKLRSERA